ncbi:hypothetical protein [Thalassobaculum sp.]|uniref:hypothetical protein n=1 Tax=Thalassobaculum sp. TaxID=2022740 RepID=UPI0032EF72AA
MSAVSGDVPGEPAILFTSIVAPWLNLAGRLYLLLFALLAVGSLLMLLPVTALGWSSVVYVPHLGSSLIAVVIFAIVYKVTGGGGPRSTA